LQDTGREKGRGTPGDRASATAIARTTVTYDYSAYVMELLVILHFKRARKESYDMISYDFKKILVWSKNAVVSLDRMYAQTTM
jgi:hypothetical protein